MLAVLVIAAKFILVVFVAGDYLDWTQWWGWVGLILCAAIGFIYLSFLAYLSILPIDKIPTSFDFDRDAKFGLTEEVGDDEDENEGLVGAEDDDEVTVELSDGIEMKVLTGDEEEIPSSGVQAAENDTVISSDQLPATAAPSIRALEHSSSFESE